MSKKPIKHACKKDYAWNVSICACECDKNCDISILKKYTCIKSTTDNLVITCDKIMDILEIVNIYFIIWITTKQTMLHF